MTHFFGNTAKIIIAKSIQLLISIDGKLKTPKKFPTDLLWPIAELA